MGTSHRIDPSAVSEPVNVPLVDALLEWTRKRIVEGPDASHGARSPDELERMLGRSITAEGIGGEAALKLFTETIVPSALPFDHPTSLAFVAAAPSVASLGFDAALGAAEIFAGNWDGGSGAIHAENQALSWLADLASWPDSARGVFVAGGTMGNLSALHTARSWYRENAKSKTERLTLLCSAEAHPSIASTARVMDVDLATVPTDEAGRVIIDEAKKALAEQTSIFAIVANAGATNCGVVDDIAALATLAKEHGAWLHVDGAYGLAALADPEARQLFRGIERADSFIVDPHKWLFAPYDCCALMYRKPEIAAQAHGQEAVYLDTLDNVRWNPSDYAIHLTRRARGLPLWFSLATYGSDAYGSAIAKTLETSRDIAAGIDGIDGLERILGPQLSIILFRCTGMDKSIMANWAEGHRRSGALLCLPTEWRGEPVFRLCLVSPTTDPTEVLVVLRTLV